MTKYRVWIPDPMSSNNIYASSKDGRKFMTTEGKEYRGEWRDLPKVKTLAAVKADYLANRPHLKSVVMIEKGGEIFIEGRVGRCFRKAKIPAFPARTKVVIEAYGHWPDKKTRDMSNFQKPIEDAFQDGGFMPNDSHLLWQNIDFKVVPEKFGLELIVYKQGKAPKWPGAK